MDDLLLFTSHTPVQLCTLHCEDVADKVDVFNAAEEGPVVVLDAVVAEEEAAAVEAVELGLAESEVGDKPRLELPPDPYMIHEGFTHVMKCQLRGVIHMIPIGRQNGHGPNSLHVAC